MIAEKILIVVTLLSFLLHRKLKAVGSSWHTSISMVSWGLISILIVRLFFWEPLRTEGPSMEPTLPAHAVVILDRRAYGFSVPWIGTQNWLSHAQHEDIIAFQQGDETLVKRVRARGGDMIEMRYPTGWFVNGVLVSPLSSHSQSWLSHAGFPESDGWTRESSAKSLMNQFVSTRSFSLTVPYGYLFVTGDNPAHSLDRRDFGFVPMYRVQGKVEAFPFLAEKSFKGRPL